LFDTHYEIKFLQVWRRQKKTNCIKIDFLGNVDYIFPYNKQVSEWFNKNWLHFLWPLRNIVHIPFYYFEQYNYQWQRIWTWPTIFIEANVHFGKQKKNYDPWPEFTNVPFPPAKLIIELILPICFSLFGQLMSGKHFHRPYFQLFCHFCVPKGFRSCLILFAQSIVPLAKWTAVEVLFWDQVNIIFWANKLKGIWEKERLYHLVST